ncbi:MAG: HPP family protein [Planctomycetota bacterium]
MLQIGDLRVGDVMTPTPTALPADTTVGAAYRVLLRERVHSAPILGHNGELLGVASVTELLEALGDALESESVATERLTRAVNRRVVDLVPDRPSVCPPDLSIPDACEQMVHERVRRLVVTKEDVPIGILSAIDVVRAVACLSDQRRRNLDDPCARPKS